jgi:hypothetical protein
LPTGLRFIGHHSASGFASKLDFVDWLVERISADPDFLEDARRRYYDLRH